MAIKPRKLFRIIWFSLVAVFFIWQYRTYQARDLPKNTFTSNHKITVTETADQIIFKPTTSTFKNEIIFFQGGLVDPEAYAPLCRNIAKQGFTCHLIKMNWRMPVWDYNKIKTLFNLPEGHYILGGHSQGGKMAAQFVYENPGVLKGLFLIGTSHPRDIDLSNRTLPTLKLYGALDGLASVPEVIENKDKLPKNTQLIELPGANHSQFGYIGKLLTDNDAAISRGKQQELTLKYLIAFFKTVENGT
ncbi:alpha/beta hydrolase [Gaetbulibacter aestuarii]|uniref:Alpha/beta hydrolase n=1 Tax=Gaetbulibacter aestuarii TaxID=1502358 RepID=A0ABW7MVH1_9FLAO